MKNLTEGEKAPLFEGKNQDGKTIKLEDLKGKRVILYFYPKDNTPGCTAEACDLRDNYEYWIKKGYIILGVSPDSEKSHTNFKTKYQLPFDLIADTNKEILRAYNAWGEKKMYGRTYEGVLRKTYVINKEGIIEKIFEKVETKKHTEQIKKVLSN